jgi:hypothetical protein
LTGQVGQKLSATEVLFCQDCLSKARPDLFVSKITQEALDKPSTPKRSAYPRGTGISLSKGGLVAIILAAAAIGVVAALMLIPRTPKAAQPSIPPDEFASMALEALFTGDDEAFLSRIDVGAFMSAMDTTGVTRRDYAQAAPQRRAELEAMHVEFLADVLCVPANRRREFQLVSFDVSENSASIRVKPWIAYGKRSYRRILLRNKRGQWCICGLAEPDF